MTDKIALGITIAIAVVFVFAIIAIVVVIIKNKKKPEEEETKEGFETGKAVVHNILLANYLNTALTKDGNTINSSIKTTVVTAIQRAINKARKELDTAVETFKKRCEERGIKDHKKATGVKKIMVQAEKTTVTSKFNMVVNLYKLLGDVTSKFKHGIKIVTEVAVPEVDMKMNTTSTISSNTHLTIEPTVQSFIIINCNYMEVPTYKYVQASIGRQRMNNGKEEMEWHESSYKYVPKVKEVVQPKSKEGKIIKLSESIPVGVVKKAEPDVVFTADNQSNPVINKSIVDESIVKIESKPVNSKSAIQDVDFSSNSASNGPKYIVAEPVKKEVVVSNYVEPVRVAESNIIVDKVENPKAEAVQASVVNNYVKSKTDGIDFTGNSAQSGEVRIPAGAICTTDEQEIKFLKALRSLK